jgi:hypothetical protein
MIYHGQFKCLRPFLYEADSTTKRNGSNRNHGCGQLHCYACAQARTMTYPNRGKQRFNDSRRGGGSKIVRIK